MSKSIPFIFLVVNFILMSNSNFAQKYSSDHHKWCKLDQYKQYMEPDSLMSDSFFYARDEKSPNFKNILKAYSFGESIHSNYNTALLLAHKELTYFSQGIVDMKLAMNMSPETQNQKFNLIVKKTIIELLDDGKYHVVLWGRYEVVE